MSIYLNRKRLVKIGAGLVLLLTVQLILMFSSRSKSTDEVIVDKEPPPVVAVGKVDMDKTSQPDTVSHKNRLKIVDGSHGSNVINLSPEPLMFSSAENLFSLLVETKPKSPPLTNYINGEKAEQKFSSDPDFHFSKSYLSSLLEVKGTTLQELKTQHQEFVEKIHHLNMSIFGDKHKTIDGEGIVMVGGGRFSWLSLLNINQLRSTGCKLPVEVFIASEQEYEPDFCEDLLPSLNAKCILGYKELPIVKYQNRLEIDGYQYKILAIFTSSFKNVLLLDADNVVVRDPRHLFEWPDFLSTGLVVWPDCWSRTTHPYYYDIAGITVGDRPVRGQFMESESPEDWNFHDLPGTLPNPSSESGMLLVNKEKHVDTMLLSMYYNMFGPSHYYPLLTQGGAGEGDKDTFIAAAYALQKPIYQVKQSMKFLGYHDDYGYHAKALGQWDPTTNTEKHMPPYMSNYYVAPEDDDSQLMFMHLSYPKLYPDKLREEISWEQNGELHHRKLYPGDLPNHDYGFDLRMWELITQLICPSWRPNSDENPASVEIPDKLRGLDMHYIQTSQSSKECEDLFLPHLEYLRTHTATDDGVYRYE